jgi:hypothetical protein
MTQVNGLNYGAVPSYDDTVKDLNSNLTSVPEHKDDAKCSALETTVNLIALITGSGMLALPYAASSMGWTAVLVLIFLALLFLYSFGLIAEVIESCIAINETKDTANSTTDSTCRILNIMEENIPRDGSVSEIELKSSTTGFVSQNNSDIEQTNSSNNNHSSSKKQNSFSVNVDNSYMKSNLLNDHADLSKNDLPNIANNKDSNDCSSSSSSINTRKIQKNDPQYDPQNESKNDPMMSIDYVTLGKMTFGSYGGNLVMAGLFLELFLALVSFLINIGLNIAIMNPRVDPAYGILLGTIISLLLAFLELKYAAYTSLLGVCLTSLLFFALLIAGWELPESDYSIRYDFSSEMSSYNSHFIPNLISYGPYSPFNRNNSPYNSPYRYCWS